MAISINDINNTHITNTSKNKQTAVTDDKTSSASTGNATLAASDTISFTDSGRLIQQLEAQLESYPVVDAEKVAQTRENLNSGNHIISAESIANKFTRYESLLEATR